MDKTREKGTNLRKAAQIFLRDLKRVLRNPVAVIVALGVCIIPSLYAWFNILANWDPYENTSTVPIAVVVEDEGADVADLGYTNAGDMVRDRLEENDQLGWTFVDDEAEAIDGVSAGRYYAAFVIPEDFTASLADVLDGDTEKAHVGYYVNEKANAISPKVTDTGADTLETQISNEFVKVVGQTVTDKLQGVVGGVAQGVDHLSACLATDLHDLGSGLGDLAGGLDDAQGTLGQARDTIAQAQDTLRRLGGASDGLAGSLRDAMGGLAGVRTQAQGMVADLSRALGTGLDAVSGISSEASYDIGQIAGDVSWATTRVDDAINQVRAANGTVQSVRASLDVSRTTILQLHLTDEKTIELRDQVANGLGQQIDVLVQLSDRQLAALDQLQGLADQVGGAADDVRGLADSLNGAVQGTVGALGGLQGDLASQSLPALSGALDSFADVGGRLAGSVGAVGPMLDQADDTLAQLDGVLQQASDTLSQTSSLVRDAGGAVSGLGDDVAAIQSAETFEGISDVLALSPEQTGAAMGSPVEMVPEAVFPVRNYGSGVTPFYTNLALWVGGFVLVAIYKLEVDEDEVGSFKPWQGFFGRWLLLNLLGQLQAVICCVGDLALGIQCVHPVAFVFAGMVASFVYVFFIYAMSVAFKHIGKAICVLLVVLQIPGASGLYPIQMQPGFFQALNPWLPFTYGINAMREAIAGFYGSYYAQNLLVLLVYLLPALLVGVAARRHLLNINALFDKKMGETDLLITERVGMDGARFKLATIVKALMDSEEYHDVFVARAAKFELMYPTLVRRGLLALLVVPLVLLALLFVLPAKFALLVCWVISLVLICTFLIVVEYLHDRVIDKTSLSDMSKEELYGLLGDELRRELCAFAPIEKMHLDEDSPLARFGAQDGDVTRDGERRDGSDAHDDGPAADGGAQGAGDVTERLDQTTKGGDAR